MTGVLQRMVARARGGLPQVQPRVSGGPVPAPARGLQNEEAALVPGPPSPELRSPESTGASSPRTASDPSMRTVFVTPWPPGRDASPHPGPPDASPNSAPHQEPAPDRTPDGSIREPSEIRLLSKPPSFRDRSGPEPHPDPGTMDSRGSEGATWNTPRAKADSPEHREAQSSVDVGAGSPGGDGETFQTPPVERTEINISIGTIELRGPRAEAKTPMPAFRPRVSLDEFLRRGQESRR